MPRKLAASSLMLGPTLTVYVPSAVCAGKLMRQVVPLTGATLVGVMEPPGPVIRTSPVANEDAWMGMLKEMSTELTVGVTATDGAMLVMLGPPKLPINPPSNATELVPAGMRERRFTLRPLTRA